MLTTDLKPLCSMRLDIAVLAAETTRFVMRKLHCRAEPISELGLTESNVVLSCVTHLKNQAPWEYTTAKGTARHGRVCAAA